MYSRRCCTAVPISRQARAHATGGQIMRYAALMMQQLFDGHGFLRVRRSRFQFGEDFLDGGVPAQFAV